MMDLGLLWAFFRPSAWGRRTVDFGRVLSAHALGSRHPLFVQVLVTARCNLACAYCELPPMRFVEMTDDEVSGVLDDLCASGMRKVSFTGGEPLLRGALPAWIRRVKARGVFANVITNGWFLEERAEELRAADLVVVSVDGRAESHDAVRGPGSHARAVRGIEACRKLGIRVVTSTVLHRGTVDDIESVLALGRDLGAFAIFQPVEFAPGCTPSRATHLVLPPDELRGVYARLRDLKRSGAPVASSHWFLERAARGQSPEPCRMAGRLFCSVLPDGRVVPCNVLLGLATADGFLDARRVGVREAMRRMPRFDCAGCAAGYQPLDAMLRFRLWELR